MSEERRNRSQEEKFEKQEKEEEKEEKNWEEKVRRDPLSAAVWAVILIWAGVVLLFANLNLLDWMPFLEAWSLFFLGAGAILLLEVAIRLLMPTLRQPVVGSFILAAVFLGIGLGNLISWSCIGPAVAIGIGIYLLISVAFRRRE